MMPNRYELSFKVDENILKLDHGSDYTTVNTHTHKKTLSFIFKRMDFICELYLSKGKAWGWVRVGRKRDLGYVTNPSNKPIL